MRFDCPRKARLERDSTCPRRAESRRRGIFSAAGLAPAPARHPDGARPRPGASPRLSESADRSWRLTVLPTLQSSKAQRPDWIRIPVVWIGRQSWKAAASDPKPLAGRRNDKNPSRNFSSGVARLRAPAVLFWISLVEERAFLRFPGALQPRRERWNRTGFCPSN